MDFTPLKKVDHVKPEVVKKVGVMLKKGRREFGSSGANFTQQAFNNEWRKKEGSQYAIAEEIVKAEREYTEIIKEWVADKPNAVLIDSVYTPQAQKLNEISFREGNGFVGESYTGHILFIGNEVFVINSLPFKKKKKYSLNKHEQILQSGKEFEFTEMWNMTEKIDRWIEHLDDDALFTGIVGFTGEEAYTERYNTWFEASYRLLEKDRYTEFLDAKYEVIEDEDKNLINPNIIAQAVVRAVKPYDRYLNVFDENALKNFK